MAAETGFLTVLFERGIPRERQASIVAEALERAGRAAARRRPLIPDADLPFLREIEARALHHVPPLTLIGDLAHYWRIDATEEVAPGARTELLEGIARAAGVVRVTRDQPLELAGRPGDNPRFVQQGHLRANPEGIGAVSA